MEACLRHFQRTQNPATLPAALAGMPKEQIVGLLPKLLEPAALFSQCLSRILLPLPTGATCIARHVLRISQNVEGKEGECTLPAHGSLCICQA